MTTTQKPPYVDLLSLQKRNAETVIQQYGNYVTLLKKLADEYAKELGQKRQIPMNMAKIRVEAHDLHLKILIQEKLYNDHVAKHITYFLPQYNLDVKVMEKHWNEVMEKLSETIPLKDVAELTEKQNRLLEIYEEYKDLAPAQQEEEEIKLAYFKLLKQNL